VHEGVIDRHAALPDVAALDIVDKLHEARHRMQADLSIAESLLRFPPVVAPTGLQ
jgi:hypothetical protein